MLRFLHIAWELSTSYQHLVCADSPIIRQLLINPELGIEGVFLVLMLVLNSNKILKNGSVMVLQSPKVAIISFDNEIEI